jgi:hypothetical protein
MRRVQVGEAWAVRDVNGRWLTRQYAWSLRRPLRLLMSHDEALGWKASDTRLVRIRFYEVRR